MIIIVDIDGTLVHATASGDHVKRVALASVNKFHIISVTCEDDHMIVPISVVKRPGADLFLKSIIEKGHKLVIWSAGCFDYVHKVMRLFDVTPHEIFTNNDMIPSSEEDLKSICHKGYSLTDTIVIEDYPGAYPTEERSNIIKVSEWSPSMKGDDELIFLATCIQSGAILSFTNIIK